MATELLCRLCDTSRPCQPWTVHEREVTGYKSGAGEYHIGTETKGQCDDCLKWVGADEHCAPPPEQEQVI